MTRDELEARWLELTRAVMPTLAAERAWPVRFDHCFQRILLDNACGGRWLDLVEGRPAYRAINDARLRAAVALADAVVAGGADLHALDAKSLAWRGKRAR